MSIRRLYFIVILSGLFSCKPDLKQVDKTLDRSLLNSEKAEGVTIYYSKEGHTKTELKTPVFRHMQQNNPPYVEMPSGLEVTFYDEELHITSILTAKYGKLFEHNNNVLVRDSVVVKNHKGEMLQTEELVWNEKIQKFFTEKFVKITTPTQVIYGSGLESNQQFTEYKITNVSGIIGIENKSIPVN
ncbi:MAG: LPS export ABC transporter periplasmic protein LptC [Chitinophagaceae bacterium]|nr:LPS export ABC transporter periplasmic protein LptC [Chitinophagaceae bacterium]